MIVPSVGPDKCLMALIGEAPGKWEEIHGEPFVGGAGDILNKNMHLAGIGRYECKILNLVKIRPSTLYTVKTNPEALSYALQELRDKYPFLTDQDLRDFARTVQSIKKPKNDNDFTILWAGPVKSPVPSEHLIWWKMLLHKELAQLNTNLIVALGAQSMWATTSRTQIGKYRGSLYTMNIDHGKPGVPLQKVKTMATYHPAAVMRNYTLGATLATDLVRATDEAKTTALVLPDRKLLVAPTIGDLETFLNNKESEDLSFDIETSPGNINCISFAYRKDVGLAVPTTTKFWGGIRQLKMVLEIIDHHMRQEDTTKVAQNIVYDAQYMTRFWGILPKGKWFDTMLAHHACYSELPKSLQYLASVFTKEQYYKDELKMWMKDFTDEEQLWKYSAKDSPVTLEVKYALEEEMTNLGVWDTYNFMMSMLHPLMYMMLTGIRLDKKTMDRHKVRLTKEHDELMEVFEEKFPGINPGSPKQIANLAYNTLGLKPITKGGKITTDANAIDKLAKINKDMAMVSKIRSVRTVRSNFTDMETDPIMDSRALFSINIAGAETGRLSSDASIFGTGRNMQNIPEPMRDIFVADPGCVLIEADLVGAEADIVAHLSEDIPLINVFKRGENVHNFTARIMWPELTDEMIAADKKAHKKAGTYTRSKYFIAKKVRHTGNYRGTFVTVGNQLKCTAAEAKLYLKKFHDSCPNLRQWHDETRYELQQTRTIVSATGRKRIFFGGMDDSKRLEETLKEACAFQGQDPVGYILNVGIRNIYDKLCPNSGIELKSQVHDSVLLQVPDDIQIISDVADELRKLMRVDVTIKGRTFYIPIDVQWGYNWKDMAPIEFYYDRRD